MSTDKWTLEEVCEKGSSSLMQKNLKLGTGAFPIYGASGLLGFVDFYHRQEEYIGIVKDGAGVGRAMLLPARSSCIGTMQYLIPNQNVTAHYLYYAIQNMNLAKYNTGATIPHIYFRDYKRESIPKRSIQEQEIISEKIDKVENIIKIKREQLSHLDDLVKSQFIEMFGGYSLRDRKLDWVKIKAVAEVVGGSTPKTDRAEYWDGGFNWVTPAELKEDDYIVTKTQRTLTEDGINSCSLRRLPIGTVLLSSRAPIGKVAIAGIEMYCNQGFKNLICSRELNPLYIYALLKYNSNYLNSLGRGATFKEISKSIVENIYIPVPEIDRQNEFARFVEQTDKSKFRIKQSLEKLEMLYKSLLQEYFG